MIDPTVGPLFRVEDDKDTIQTSVVKDINFDLSLIRTCFDADAWCKVKTIYNEKREQDFTCITCNLDFNSIASVACAGCLEILHLR